MRAIVILLLGLGISFLDVSAEREGEQPCRVGVQFHLRAAPGISPENSYMRHLRAFVEADMASYGLLVGKLPDQDLERVATYLKEHDVPFLVQYAFFPVTGGLPGVTFYSPETMRCIRSVAGEHFLGVHWGEIDSVGLKPEDYLAAPLKKTYTRKEVKDAFVRRLQTALQDFRQRFPEVKTAHSSAVLSHWLFAEAGVDILCSEIGENIPCMNMMIAANRGAARAYQKPWMIDHSTWWTPRGHAGVQVSPREGHTPWCFFTSLLQAVMGGADYVQLEVDWAAYDENYNLLPWGQALQNLHALARQIGPRGETLTPFAIVLGHENGWPGVGWRIGDIRNTGLFDGIRHEFMQTRDADLSLKILDIFYPQFERCGWDPEYPGFLVESPFGPLDIVPDNLPADAYRRYRVLVALGYHHLTSGLIDSWRTFVQDGGILICSDTAFRDEQEKMVVAKTIEPLVGCLPDFRERHLISLYQPRSTLEDIDGIATRGERIEWQYHYLHPVRVTSGRVVSRMNDTPYLIENRIGKGRVFFITALNGVGSSAVKRGPEPFLYANILYHFLHTLKDHVGTGVDFSPWTGLDYVLNRKPDGSLWLLVMNHNDMSYVREMRVRGHGAFSSVQILAQGNWQNILPGSSIPFQSENGTTTWTYKMPPKSFCLFILRP